MEDQGSNGTLSAGARAVAPRRRWRVRVILTLLAAAVLLFIVGFARFAAAIETVEKRPARHADGIVALTGGSDRVADAVALLAQGHAGRLLITGVNTATTREDLARHVPGARDYVECCIDLGYRAADTVGNAQETADWVRAYGLRSLIVVTSNYHMPRALAEMTFQLPGVDLQPYSVVPDRIRPTSFGRAVHLARLLIGEYVKLIAVRTRQVLDGPAPSPDDLHLATRRTK